MHRSLMAFAVVFSFAIAQPVRAAEPITASGKLDAVCVYRGQALVTRLVDVPGPAGLRELIVTELPENLVPGSIYAESDSGVEVRSVSYRVRPVENDVREQVRQLDKQLQDISDRIDANRRQQQLLADEKKYLDGLEHFVAPTATTELSKGVLNSDTLEKLTVFQFDQRKRLIDSEQTLGIEVRELGEQKTLLERERGQIAGRSSNLAREAIVFVNLTGDAGKVKVRYLVSNATWVPSYNARSTDEKRIKLEYMASVQQMSGEDWNGVSLCLSTATPSLVSIAPQLQELSLTLTRPLPGVTDKTAQNLQAQSYAALNYEQAKSQLRLQLNEADNFRNIAGNTYNGGTVINGGTITSTGNISNSSNPAISGSVDAANVTAGDVMNGPMFSRDAAQNLDVPVAQQAMDAPLNKVANDSQLLDMLNRDRVLRRATKKGAEPSPDEGLSVTYTIAGRTSLPSRSDRQLIQIVSHDLPATIYKVASPVLTSYVYNEAQVTNKSSTVLLAGPVATYINGEFVGQATIPSISVGQTFTLGMGIDSALRASRELVEKNESMQGGNRVVEFTYRLSIENFGDKKAEVRLLDRIPTARESEIRVTPELESSHSPALSKDSGYEQTDRKRGLLRWDVEVPAEALGPKAYNMEYAFKLEYDRQMNISGLPVAKR